MSRVALIQTRTPATQAEAISELAPMVREAAAGGARLILTPEGSNLLQRDRAKLQSVLTAPEDDAVVVRMRALAAELAVEILIGSALVRRPDGQAANRSILIRADGEVVATYDKIHMFDVDLPTGETARESQLYTPGGEAVVVDSEVGRLGLTICYDVRFPGLFRALSRAGAEIITVPAAFTRPTGEAHWEILLRARAIECGCYILAAAQGGYHADGRGTYGHSLVVGPWGEVVATLDHDVPGVLYADLDLAAVSKARHAIPALKNERAFAGPLSL
jgi:predicted amidohydrolase